MASPKEGRQHTAEYDALTEMTGDLCNALPIDDLLPKMISKRVIDFHDKNEIRSERTDRDKVDLFISKLMKEMSSRENKRFYKFIEAMKESPKCDFLVRRMEEWINHFQKGTPPPIQTVQSGGSQPSVSRPTSQRSPATVTQDCGGHLVSDMKLMHKHVIPRISAEWETVAAFLEYNIPTKKSICKTNRGLPRDCCIELLEDWITTDNGAKPKTWEKFIEVLSEISSLAVVTKQIKQCLCQEGVLGGQGTSQQQMSHQPAMAPPVPQQPLLTELDVDKKLELQKDVFTNCQQHIVQYLSPDDVMDILVSKHLIGHTASQKLRLPIMTSQDKNRIIVDELSSGGPDVFEKFCEILKKNKRTKHIADHLEKEWRELILESSQNDSEQPHYSPPIHTKVPTALPQPNTVTTTTNKQQKVTAPQQTTIIRETTTAPAEQGEIAALTEQAITESHECYDDMNTQEVTSPVSESEEGYYQSTGIYLEEERNGQLDKSTASPTTTTAVNVAITHDVTAAHDHVTIAATATTTAPPAPSDIVGAGDIVNVTSDIVNVTHNVTDEDSLATGKDSKKCMRLMRMCVIPKICEEWEAVAAFLDYSIQAKDDIKKKYKTPRECCRVLLEDWVNTDNGLKPKTWNKFIEVLSEIEELEPVIDEIKQELMSEGVILYEAAAAAAAAQTQTQPQYSPEDQSTDDAATDLSWYHQPESVNTMAGSEQLQSDLHHHSSYAMPSVDMNQRYGREMDANQLSQPIYRPQPHAFIVYAKEENDPDGEQVRCLSDLLYNSRINCDIDLYHINDNNINSDWPYWVEINLRNYITYPHSYVILVCSPTMSSSLGNADAYVEMVAAHIHSQNLRPYLQQYAENFLPLLITNPSTDYVPPSLSKQTCYYFPYDKLNDMSENVSTLEVLDHPDFASLKKLVATLTGPFVAEVKQEYLEAHSTGGAPPTDANATPNAPGTVTE